MYIDFEKIMKRAKSKFDSDENQREYVISSIELAKRYILNYIKNNPVLTPEKLKYGILNTLSKEEKEFVTISNINGNLFRHEIANLLIKDSKERERLYKKVRSETRDDGLEYYIDRHFEDKKEDFVRELIGILDETKLDTEGNIDIINRYLQDIINRYLQGDKEAIILIDQKRSNMPLDKRKILDSLIEKQQKRDLDMLKDLVSDAKEILKEGLRKSFVDILVLLGKFFEDNGLLNKYIRRNNQQLDRIGLSALCIDREEFDKNNIFNEEFLRGLKDFDKLALMTSFWINRYTKDIKHLNDGIFAINILDLWGDILEGKTDFEISDEQLRAIFCKTEFLKLASDMTKKSAIKKLKEKKATILDKDDDVVTLDIQEELQKISKIVRLSYHNEFEGILPNSDRQISDDLDMYSPLEHIVNSAYEHKNEILSTQILSYIRNNRIRNWGYIEDDDAKKQNNNMVIIGIDYEGYNMPIRMHMPREKILEILKQTGVEPDIPIYEGNEDFNIDGKMLKSHIIMMLTSKNESELRRLLSENNKPKEIMDLLEHFNFLRDADKYPMHLMTPIKVKGKTTFVRKPRRYINLESNEVWIKGQNGSLKKEDAEGR